VKIEAEDYNNNKTPEGGNAGDSQEVTYLNCTSDNEWQPT